jgi:hypothetical protein
MEAIEAAGARKRDTVFAPLDQTLRMPAQPAQSGSPSGRCPSSDGKAITSTPGGGLQAAPARRSIVAERRRPQNSRIGAQAALRIDYDPPAAARDPPDSQLGSSAMAVPTPTRTRHQRTQPVQMCKPAGPFMYLNGPFPWQFGHRATARFVPTTMRSSTAPFRSGLNILPHGCGRDWTLPRNMLLNCSHGSHNLPPERPLGSAPTLGIAKSLKVTAHKRALPRYHIGQPAGWHKSTRSTIGMITSQRCSLHWRATKNGKFLNEYSANGDKFGAIRQPRAHQRQPRHC